MVHSLALEQCGVGGEYCCMSLASLSSTSSVVLEMLHWTAVIEVSTTCVYTSSSLITVPPPVSFLQGSSSRGTLPMTEEQYRAIGDFRHSLPHHFLTEGSLELPDDGSFNLKSTHTGNEWISATVSKFFVPMSPFHTHSCYTHLFVDGPQICGGWASLAPTV